MPSDEDRELTSTTLVRARFALSRLGIRGSSGSSYLQPGFRHSVATLRHHRRSFGI
jgi:hypothetical protein